MILPLVIEFITILSMTQKGKRTIRELNLIDSIWNAALAFDLVRMQSD